LEETPVLDFLSLCGSFFIERTKAMPKKGKTNEVVATEVTTEVTEAVTEAPKLLPLSDLELVEIVHLAKRSNDGTHPPSPYEMLCLGRLRVRAKENNQKVV
jgi:hypothetical protein